MSRSDCPSATDGEVVEEYVLDVRIVARASPSGDDRYQFEAPRHEGIAFDDADAARLYADIYFDVNGFQEAGTGERGVPPEIVQAGRDTLAAYFLAQPKGPRGTYSPTGRTAPGTSPASRSAGTTTGTGRPI